MPLTLAHEIDAAIRMLPPALAGRFTSETHEEILVLGRSSRTRFLLASLMSACADRARSGDPLLLLSKDRGLTVDVEFQFDADPHFLLILRRLLEQPAERHHLASLLSYPDNHIALLLIKRLAGEEHVMLRLQGENDARVSIVCQFLAPPPHARTQREKPLILIIEDNKDIRRLIELYLTQAGYDTVSADGGEKGLQIARESIPDLITLDLWMPSKDGWQVLQALKSETPMNTIPVIIVSIMRDQQIGFDLGASDYVVKPIQHQLLVHAVRRLLSPSVRQAAAERPLHKIGVIDPDLRGVHTILGARKDIEWIILESTTPGVYESIETARPDALLFVAGADPAALLPLMSRLRLFDPLDRAPFFAFLPEGASPAAIVPIEGMFDGTMHAGTIGEYGFFG